MEAEQNDQIAVLVLEDGAVFYGRPFGAVEMLTGRAGHGRRGEVVFATGMTGYQEICTDPSYRGQMVCLTYPLIGNYGIAAADAESHRPWLSALLVRECCEEFSNWRATGSLNRFLLDNGIPGVSELDTRALTRHLRTSGTLRGVLRAYAAGTQPNGADVAALVVDAQQVASVSQLDVVGEVANGAEEIWKTDGHWPQPLRASGGRPYIPGRRSLLSGERRFGSKSRKPHPPRVLLIDTGFKHNIARCLAARGLEVVVTPPRVSVADLERLHPDGVLLANGPGDPESVLGLVELTRELLARRIPLMGICLGHQILGLAAGATTSRLPFGHHGANHPVKELRTGRVTVTSQNHTFQVDAASLPPASGFSVSHINLSDGSVEGLAHETLPVFSVQYHPEAASGPEDNLALFDRFAALIEGGRGRRLRRDEATQDLALAVG